mgnify:CR=1 FL=1
MCCGTIQTRGNFPLPYSVPQCYSNKGQLSVAMQCPSNKGQFSIVLDLRLCISTGGFVLVQQWPFVKIVFENFY